jgi:hypothetical protein
MASNVLKAIDALNRQKGPLALSEWPFHQVPATDCNQQSLSFCCNIVFLLLRCTTTLIYLCRLFSFR